MRTFNILANYISVIKGAQKERYVYARITKSDYFSRRDSNQYTSTMSVILKRFLPIR